MGTDDRTLQRDRSAVQPHRSVRKPIARTGPATTGDVRLCDPPRPGYSQRRSRSSLGPARAIAKTTVGLLVQIRLESISPLTDRPGRPTFLASSHSHGQPCGGRAAACRDNRICDINLRTIMCATRDRKNGPSGDGVQSRFVCRTS